MRTCAEHLGEDWHYGGPLIADALARGDLAAAEKFVEATLTSLLRADPDEPWRPCPSTCGWCFAHTKAAPPNLQHQIYGLMFTGNFDPRI